MAPKWGHFGLANFQVFGGLADNFLSASEFFLPEKFWSNFSEIFKNFGKLRPFALVR